MDVKAYIKPTHILQSIQLVCYNWFAQRCARLQPQAPDFSYIIYNVILNTYILPNLPQPIYRLAYPKQGPTGMPSTASKSGVSGNSSASSIVSGLMNASSQQGSQQVPGGQLPGQDQEGVIVKEPFRQT
jgi:hypothetical protein